MVKIMQKNIWQFFYLNRVNRNKYWKIDSNTFILPRKREYVLLPVLHVAETVKKKRKPQCCKSQNITRNMQLYLFYLYWQKKIFKKWA